MHILIEDFAKYICGDGGQVWVSGEQALNNLKYQIMLLQRAERPS